MAACWTLANIAKMYAKIANVTFDSHSDVSASGLKWIPCLEN